jgi:signal transduction histidine kinase
MNRRVTFQMRLVLAITAIVAFAVVLLGAIAFATVRISLESSLDTRLGTTVRAIRSVVDVRHGRMQNLEGEDRAEFLSLLGQRVNGAVLRADGSVMASDLTHPPSAVIAAIAATHAPHGIVNTNSGDIVYVTQPIADNGKLLGTAAAWESRSSFDDALRATTTALIGAGIVLVLIAAAAGGLLARRVLRPVTELSAMISHIEASDLAERLKWDGPNDELGRLCMTFDRLLDRLETAFNRERRFIADASHDLRTPLTVMRAEAELALMHERTPGEYRTTLQRLQAETRRLETFAQSLLLSARQDAGAGAPVPLAIDAVAQRATERMRPLAIARTIALTNGSAGPALALGDADALESAVVALIDNALRFAPAGGNVDVATLHDEQTVTIVVSDSGPGFTNDGLREATGRFWRDDPARSGAGSGLGLSIARSIVEHHQGTIILRNGETGGAIVALTLPRLGANNGVIGATATSPA